MNRLTRRSFLAGTAALQLRAGTVAGRLGIACPLSTNETAARDVLRIVREAGFTRVQMQFSWESAGDAFLRALPHWLTDEGISGEVVGAYVNCVSPANVLMGCRREDFIRAIDFAGYIGARRIVAWTGGYGKGLMTPDPRNFTREAEDAICRFLDPYHKRIEDARLQLALETYITLTCPDAISLARVLTRLPKKTVGAVVDPPNLTPIARYEQRDVVLKEMFEALSNRIALVHFKDFLLAPSGTSYQLPGPLKGATNYRLFAELVAKLPADTPLIAEHLKPSEFASARKELLTVLGPVGLG
ncbi:MAG: TIM barrel protein [Bryobacteraceae bacterium]